MRDLRKVVDSAPGQRVLIGEIYTETPQQLLAWYGARHDELQLPMDTQLGFLDKVNGKLDAAAFRAKLTDAQTQLGGNTPLFVFDNHDRPRSWDRYGDGTHNAAIARVIATIQLASQSADILYYGQELGMVTTPPTRKQDVKDPIGILGWPVDKGRDGERTPMQWSRTLNAGFSSSATTWLPVPATLANADVNVESEQADPHSLLHWYTQLLQLRRERDTMLAGSQTMLNFDQQNALVWVRRSKAVSLLNPPIVIACNLSAQPVTLALKQQLQQAGLRGNFLRTILRSDDAMGPQDLDAVTLPPFGVYIGELQR
jgi:alpha-glucosidase